MAETKIDEFAFVLIAGIIILIVMLLMWGVPTQTQLPIVEPDSQSLVINRGSIEKFILKINVTSNKVTLTPKGTIKDWIKIGNNGFESSGLSSVEISVKVPSGTEERDYYGSIEVESEEGGKVVVPLTITVIGSSSTTNTEVSRIHYIGDFTVTYVAGSEVLKTMNNVEVSGNKKVSFSSNVDMSMVTDGLITIDVFYTNNEGNLVVKLNNQVLYDDQPGVGELELPVSMDMLKSYSVIEISTTKPGWKFWTSSVYRIDKVEFSVNYFGNVEKKETFEVVSEEITNFKEGRVEFKVEDYEGNGNLVVKINDYKVYEDTRQGNVAVAFRFEDVGLTRNQNTISFSTETGTTYNIKNARVVIITK